VIEASWLTLRRWEPADTPFVFDACQDAEIQRWAGVPRPFTAADAARYVTAAIAQEGGGFSFAITVTETGELLGAVALEPDDDGQGALCFWTAPESRRKGAASIALAAVADWALSSLGLREVRLSVGRDNERAIRVAERAGFTRMTIAEGGLIFVRRAQPPN
jgi:RimJ/RimL family protein N-acetyltransferase